MDDLERSGPNATVILLTLFLTVFTELTLAIAYGHHHFPGLPLPPPRSATPGVGRPGSLRTGIVASSKREEVAQPQFAGLQLPDIATCRGRHFLFQPVAQRAHLAVEAAPLGGNQPIAGRHYRRAARTDAPAARRSPNRRSSCRPPTKRLDWTPPRRRQARDRSRPAPTSSGGSSIPAARHHARQSSMVDSSRITGTAARIDRMFEPCRQKRRADRLIGRSADQFRLHPWPVTAAETDCRNRHRRVLGRASARSRSASTRFRDVARRIWRHATPASARRRHCLSSD